MPLPATEVVRTPVIQVRELTKVYEFFEKEPGLLGSLRALFWRRKQYREAVRGISFTLYEGERVGFLGPNGAGKTTTLKMLAGILHPTAGEARVLGYVPWERHPDYQRSFALVLGQKNQLWWDLPPLDSFLLNRDIYDVDPREFDRRVEELSDLLGIRHLLRVPVRQLSLGERMKCELAAALLHGPRVLFLDEPTIGLDVVSQDRIHQFLLEYNRRYRTTLLLTSHYMRDVERLCERVMVIHQGSILYDGSLTHLRDQYAPYRVLRVHLARPVSPERFRPFGEVLEVEENLITLRIPKGDTPRVTARLLRDLPVVDLSIQEVEVTEVVRRIFEEAEGTGTSPAPSAAEEAGR